MPRFFVSPENIKDSSIQLFSDDINHIINVLRMKEGEELTVCDTKGNDYYCVIEHIEKKEVILKVLNSEKNKAEPDVNITLYQGLPKQDKMELIIQKCVELGVTKIVPVSTERAVVKLKDGGQKKVERWQKISESAAKQSGRGVIPRIGQPVSFAEAIGQMETYDLALMPYELEKEQGIKGLLEGFQGKNISIFIGPEGGFSKEECEKALDAGIIPVTLGKRILRTETAGFVALTLILYEIGDL